MSLIVNTQRLKKDIEDLAQVGRVENQGIYRMAFSDGDIDAEDSDSIVITELTAAVAEQTTQLETTYFATHLPRLQQQIIACFTAVK